jgi:hypothetical protein
MKRLGPVLTGLVLVAALGCNRVRSATLFDHKLGESFADFSALEHPATDTPPGIPYTGTIHCFDTPDLGDKCKGRHHEIGGVQFDNAHFTFVNGTLDSVATVGAGGIIGDAHQNWNWNLYLSKLMKQYGKPDTMTAKDAVWKRGGSVVHAYLTVEPMMFNPSQESQTEHIDLLSRDSFEKH